MLHAVVANGDLWRLRYDRTDMLAGDKKHSVLSYFTGGGSAATMPVALRTANLCTKLLDFRGFDSNIILILRGGILMSIGDFPESLSQAILAGILLVGRLGVRPTYKVGMGQLGGSARVDPCFGGVTFPQAMLPEFIVPGLLTSVRS